MENLIIRNETENDYSIVEKITRDAFWNLYVPGCDQHYLVHTMRKHEDFIPELSLVVELNNQIIGNIMYTKTKLIDESKQEKIILTFGPISILPEFQRKGIGKKLLEYSFTKAIEMGFDSIVIFGAPSNYVSRDFKSCKKYNVCLENDIYPTAMLVKELKPNVFDGRKWYYYESSAYKYDSDEAQKFDKLFETKKKMYQASHEEFYILSNSVIN